MQNIKNIDSEEIRIEDKRICQMWLRPEALTAKQIRDNIRAFASVVLFTLHPKTDEEYIASNVAILVEDIIGMDIAEEEKNKRILAHIHNYPSDTRQISNLAKRAMKQIDIDADNYKKEGLRRGYCKELIKRA